MTKTLPTEITKSKLIKMYMDQYSERTIREAINAIIIDKRGKLPIYQGLNNFRLSCIKKINKDEFLEFVQIYGAPSGYEMNIE